MLHNLRTYCLSPGPLLLSWAIGAAVVACVADARGAEQNAPAASTPASTSASAPPRQKLDLSGRKRTGEASFYANRFAGRQMADGQRMNPNDDNAASKTLPLGTTAKVTNLETGQSTVVTIQDRGPYVKGRIVDLSPSSAPKIGITRDEGVAKVEVAPIAVPLPDGSVKPGSAAADAKPKPESRVAREGND